MVAERTETRKQQQRQENSRTAMQHAVHSRDQALQEKAALQVKVGQLMERMVAEGAADAAQLARVKAQRSQELARLHGKLLQETLQHASNVEGLAGAMKESLLRIELRRGLEVQEERKELAAAKAEHARVLQAKEAQHQELMGHLRSQLESQVAFRKAAELEVASLRRIMAVIKELLVDGDSETAALCSILLNP
jgi:hypothetical protein